MNGALVSIVIPYYNKKDTISRSVNSVLAQTYTNWELIIIDDCGEDKLDINTLPHDKRIRVLFNESNRGAAKTRQRGLENAEGEYVAFLDADDWWESEFLKVALVSLDYNPSVLMTYFVRDQKYLGERELLKLREAIISHKRRWGTGSILWRRQYLGYWPNWVNNEDSMFEVLCSKVNNSIVRAPGCLFNQGFDSNYRLSEVGVNHGETNKLKIWKHLFRNHWSDLDIKHKGILFTRLIKGVSKTNKYIIVRITAYQIYRVLQKTKLKIIY